MPVGVDGFEIGGRHALAWELAAADGDEPIAYLVAEFRAGDWLLGDEWAARFDSVEKARRYAAATVPPYRVAVFAVVPVDRGRFYPVVTR